MLWISQKLLLPLFLALAFISQWHRLLLQSVHTGEYTRGYCKHAGRRALGEGLQMKLGNIFFQVSYALSFDNNPTIIYLNKLLKKETSPHN